MPRRAKDVPDPVRLYGAGSLREALWAIASAFTAACGVGVAARFGPSGLLRREIEAGAAPDLFASADMGHPRALAAAGLSGPAVLFARSPLCLLARPGVAFAPAEALDRMLDPGLRLGISTPGADPSGDYALAVFARADAQRPGSAERLRRKALVLAGGAIGLESAPARSPYAALIAGGRTDLFLTYRSNALSALAEAPAAGLVALPPSLAVEAEYGLCTLSGATRGARDFADFVLSAEGQAILVAAGFDSDSG